jgi:hypothetical protein
MFRGVSSENIRKKLICKICGFVDENIPVHHDRPMTWNMTGSFRKTECLKCQVCGHIVEIPTHCNTPMFYSEAEYRDLPDFTKSDRSSMRSLKEEK